MLQYKHFWKEF